MLWCVVLRVMQWCVAALRDKSGSHYFISVQCDGTQYKQTTARYPSNLAMIQSTIVNLLYKLF